MLLILLCLEGHAQNELSPFSVKKASHFVIGTGINYIQLRDLSSSPLYYSGITPEFNVGFISKSVVTENEINTSYSLGQLSNNMGEDVIKTEINSVMIGYQHLRRVKALSSASINTKLGGLFEVLGNYRYNEGLNNFGMAYELIPTLFFSVKTELDISRKEEKKFFFNKLRFLTRKRLLSYQLNFGLVNSNIRGDIPYLLNSSVSNDLDFWEATTFDIFSGFRFSSALNYTIYHDNFNAICFSYRWNALQTNNDGFRFEQTNHLLGISLWFNTKRN